MLLLLFRVADNRYAVDSHRVVEVAPRIDLRPLPHAPGFLVGLFDYRGGVVPVVDLGLLLGGPACQARLSTRIMIVNAAGTRGKERLGLIAEHVQDVKTVRDDAVVFPALSLEQAPYLGAIVRVEDGLVQTLNVERILNEPLRTALFGARRELT